MTPQEARQAFEDAADYSASSTDGNRHRSMARAWGAFAQALLERFDEANRNADIERRVTDLEEFIKPTGPTT